jgi:hypothetical protein
MVDALLDEREEMGERQLGVADVEYLLDSQAFREVGEVDGSAEGVGREDGDAFGREDGDVRRTSGSNKRVKHAAVDVWEDGESFWQPKEGLQRGEIMKSMIISGAENMDPVDCHSPIKMNIVPPSVEGTPMSVYDAHGFLKS